MRSSPPEPEASIVIAAFNAERSIARAVSSALAQRDAAVEVLLVDDASEDATVATGLAAARGDPRLTVLRQSRNAGPAAARNRALGAARAPWITALDSDDFLLPGRLRRLLDIARREDADFVADDLWRQAESDPDGRHRWRLWSAGEIGERPITAAYFIRGNLTVHPGQRRELGFIKPLMSRDFLRRHDLDYPDLRLGEDYALYAAALVAGARFILTDPAGYVSVVREASLSGDHPTGAHGALVAVDTALLTRTRDPATRAALRAHRRAAYREWMWRRMIDAKRARDMRAAASCFWAPPAVAADLSRRLLGEAARRLRRRFLRG